MESVEYVCLYGVRGKLLNAVKSFYKGSVACVRIENCTSDCFSVNIGFRQGCVMSPWLFNIYMDGVVREVKDNTEGIGIKLVNKNGVEWIMSQLLYVDDTTLVAESEENLQYLVNQFE